MVFLFHYIKNLQGTKTKVNVKRCFVSFITSKTYKVLKLMESGHDEFICFITSKTYKVLKLIDISLAHIVVSLHQKLTRY